MLHSGMLQTLISRSARCAVYWLFKFALVTQCVGSLAALAQTSSSVVPICEVLESPEKFDKQSLQLRGNILLYFEDFTLRSVACPNKFPGIWLTFGGDVATPTISTVNDNVRQSGITPRFEGVQIPITKDDTFEKFFALITARKKQDPHYSGSFYGVTATLTGLFLAGNTKLRSDGKPEFPGYGHMGMFHLFVITKVEAVDAQPTPRLDISGTVTDEDGKPLSGVEVDAQTVNCCQ